MSKLPSQRLLSKDQMDFWDAHGFLLLKNALSTAEKRALGEWTEELERWPEAPGKWMKYFESGASGSGRQLCRVENFIPFHSGFAEFLEQGRILGLLSELMGEQAVLFKEKINFKLPGGKGFKFHQDAPAFTSFHQTYHITMMAAIDPSTIENGCLEIVSGGYHKRGILNSEKDGTLARELVEALPWEPVLMEPGDLLFFDSYVPHGSKENRSPSPRRALYITYNRESEGSYRNEYFKQKRRCFPPECERVPGVDYSKVVGPFNLGNPID